MQQQAIQGTIDYFTKTMTKCEEIQDALNGVCSWRLILFSMKMNRRFITMDFEVEQWLNDI